jgi:hypothetical protein
MNGPRKKNDQSDVILILMGKVLNENYYGIKQVILDYVVKQELLILPLM